MLKKVLNALQMVAFEKPLHTQSDYQSHTYSFKLFWPRNAFKPYIPAKDFSEPKSLPGYTPTPNDFISKSDDVDISSGWNDTSLSTDTSSYSVVVDEEAQFIGGTNAFIQFVSDSFRYPQRCLDSIISGDVELTFVIDLAGSVKKNIDYKAL